MKTPMPAKAAAAAAVVVAVLCSSSAPLASARDDGNKHRRVMSVASMPKAEKVAAMSVEKMSMPKAEKTIAHLSTVDAKAEKVSKASTKSAKTSGKAHKSE